MQESKIQGIDIYPMGQQNNKRNKLQGTDIIKAARTLLVDELQTGYHRQKIEITYHYAAFYITM